jgi:hypothetical protein
MILPVLFRSFWIRIQLFKPGQINKWQISNKHNDTAERLFKYFKYFLRKICSVCSNQRRIGNKKNYQSERSDPDPYLDPVQLFRIQIRPGQEARNRPDPDPQHCGLPSQEKLKK